MRGHRRNTYMTETFQSDYGDRTSNRFMMDRTLYKGIKQNDVSKIIDVSNEAGQIGEKQLPSEEQELQTIVIQMRKKYDEIKTNTAALQAEIDKNRKAIDLLKAEEDKLTLHNNNARNNYESKQQQQENITAAVEAKIFDLDIYKEMADRLKKDILLMKKRNFDRDLALKKDRVKMKSLRQDDFNKTKLSYKCRDMLQSIQRTVMHKQYERTSKINTFYDALNRRHQNIVKREERDREIEEVMMKAMSEKLQEEKEWINICLVNLFFKKFLKNKMETIIEENFEIENAYHKIKSSTDIKDCKDLISRFLNRQRDYGALLERIAEKQYKLQDLKEEKQNLEKISLELKQKSEEIMEASHRNISMTTELEKELDRLEDELKGIQEKKELMRKWGVKLFCSLYGKSREQMKEKYSQKPFKELVVGTLQEINKQVDRILGDENSSDRINNAFMSDRPVGNIFQDSFLSRNKRIKTTMGDESLLQADDREAFYDGNSEVDYLHYNRRVTKKNDQSRRFRIKTQQK